jgi:RNA polymerase sigma-70 factor (ECF subfamily)
MTDSGKDFMRWYAPLHERFARYCASQSLGMNSSSDLMQDAILSALEQWDRIEDKDRLLSYMVGIVNNRLRNHLRSAAVHRKYLESRKRVLHDRLPARPELALDLHFLLRAVDTLPASSREALLLSTVSGFSIREIADIQGASEAAVKTRISRARQRLRELFSEEGRPLSIGERLQIYASILL